MRTILDGIILDCHIEKESNRIVIEFDRGNIAHLDPAALMDLWPGEVVPTDRQEIKQKLVGLHSLYEIDKFGYVISTTLKADWTGPKVPRRGLYLQEAANA